MASALLLILGGGYASCPNSCVSLRPALVERSYETEGEIGKLACKMVLGGDPLV